jgi:hypothetical protein
MIAAYCRVGENRHHSLREPDFGKGIFDMTRWFVSQYQQGQGHVELGGSTAGLLRWSLH